MKMNREISILVVEDDYLVSEEVVRCLNILGFVDISKATNGKEAVDVACSERYDIIIMDIKMPELDGISAAEQILKCCSIPVIILTAYDSDELLLQASSAGVSAYLPKPPRLKEMKRAITLALARHADMMELRRLNKALEQALDEIKTLRGILPICSSCKKIRNDNGYWEQIENYIRDHSEAEFSHGLCNDCAKRLYPEFYHKIFGDKDTGEGPDGMK